MIRACIRPLVTAVGKADLQHIREDPGAGIKVNPEPYMRLLLEEPNPYMTCQMLLEKMVGQLLLNNNSFALIIRDEFGYPSQIYPIICNSAQVEYGSKGEIKLRFSLPNGQIPLFDYSDVIHLRRDFLNDDMFGEPQHETLEPVMEVITTIDQGIVKAIKNSLIIRWILKFKSALRPEDQKEHVKTFVENYMNTETGVGGAIASDGKYEAEQVKPESYVPNAPQMDRMTKRLYNYFNTNESIIQSKFNEDEWNAYYEANVEPILKQLSNEASRKMFTRRQRGFGNKIIASATSLQYASMKTKLGLVSMVDRASMKPNEWRKVMNLPPVEGGEKLLRRKDTGVLGEGGEEDQEDQD